MCVCCQFFEPLPFERSSNQSSTTAIGLPMFFALSQQRKFCKLSAGLLPTPASPPIQKTQPKKNLGASQTDHREGLRHPRSVAKRNAKTLKNRVDLGETQSKNSWEKSGSKTDRKHVCLDDTSPTSSLRRNLPTQQTNKKKINIIIWIKMTNLKTSSPMSKTSTSTRRR